MFPPLQCSRFFSLLVSSPLLLSILPPQHRWWKKNNCSVNAVVLNGIFVCLGHGKWLGHAEQSNIKKLVKHEGWVWLNKVTFPFSMCLELSD